MKKMNLLAYVLVAVLAAVCLGLYIANANQPYYQSQPVNSTVIWTTVGALVAAVVCIAAPKYLKGGVAKLVCDVAKVAAAALIIYAGLTFVGLRVESFGYIYGSNLEMGNEAAFTAGDQAITTIVVYVVTWVIALVAAFLPDEKKA